MKNLFKIGEIVSILIKNNNLGVVIAVDEQKGKYDYWVIPLLTQKGENGIAECYFENELNLMQVNKEAIQCMTNGKKRISMVRRAEKTICGHPVHNYPKTVDN